MTNSAGEVVDVDLNKVGDVFGAPTGTGSLKTVSLKSTGYEGSYGPPASFAEGIADDEDASENSVDVITATGERRTRIVKRSAARGRRQRFLQDATVTGDSFGSPLYCINQGDNFMFNIENPNAYPQYDKESTLNSNLNFDYGAF